MSEQSRPIVDVNVDLKITSDGAGGYNFQYTGDHFDAAGNFDFSASDLLGKSVRIHYTITTDSIAGARFQQTGGESFWIIEKSLVGPTGCPSATYQGDEFKEWVTSSDRLQLHVLDVNDDGKLYRYALRFDINGATVLHDPDGTNGNNH